MANPMGPYDTEAQAQAEPMPQAVAALHDAGRVRSGDPDHLARTTVLDALLRACDRAGVELGAFDARVLAGTAWRSEPTTVQVVIGLISRAYAAGREAGDA